MIGTKLDQVDVPRMLRGRYGWWFIGNGTRTLLSSDSVAADGTIDSAVQDFLHESGAFRPRDPECFSLTVLTTTTCNLGCGYCFQNTAMDPTGGYRPLRIEREWLDSVTVERIVNFTKDRMTQAGFDGLHLLLFGGEPLLNPRGCLDMLSQASTIGLQTGSIATNGVLLTPKLATELESAGLTGGQITFDGSREDHDQIRVHRAGRPTFDKIVTNLARAIEVTALSWHLRVNVSHHNYERVGELFDQLAVKVDATRCVLSFAWVGDAGFGYENNLHHIDEVVEMFAGWSSLALESGFRVAWPTMKTTCQICSNPGGAAGAVVNADGTLYSCWQSAGKPGFEVGSIADGYLPVDRVRDRWVTCGYEYAQEDEAVVVSFQDRVDARLLDYLYDTGRL